MYVFSFHLTLPDENVTKERLMEYSLQLPIIYTFQSYNFNNKKKGVSKSLWPNQDRIKKKYLYLIIWSNFWEAGYIYKSV